jgi:hypothetical protein
MPKKITLDVTLHPHIPIQAAMLSSRKVCSKNKQEYRSWKTSHEIHTMKTYIHTYIQAVIWKQISQNYPTLLHTTVCRDCFANSGNLALHNLNVTDLE